MEYKADRSWHKSAEQSGQVEGGEERRVGPEPGHEPLRLYVEVVGEKVEVEGEYGGDDAAEGERVERHPAGRVPGRAGVVAVPLQPRLVQRLLRRQPQLRVRTQQSALPQLNRIKSHSQLIYCALRNKNMWNKIFMMI